MFCRILLILAMVGTLVPGLRAQAPMPAAPLPAAAVPEPSDLREIVEGLPRPADVPRSLMEPPPPQVESNAAAERPYFQVDPLLDPPGLDRPGWFFAAEMQLTKPHAYRALAAEPAAPFDGSVPPFTTVIVDSAPLNWTVGPKLTAGYRLPSGFGGIGLSGRFFDSQGSAIITPNVNSGLDAATPAVQHSRLAMNMVDLDYFSREYTPFPRLGMKWWLGMRLQDFFFDSQDTEPAGGGGGVDSIRGAMQTLSIGGHFGVETDFRLRRAGLLLVQKLDVASGFAKTNQSFFASSSVLGVTGFQDFSRSTSIPYVNWQFGLGWQPPRWPRAQFFMGSQMEYWWTVGDDANSNSRLDIANFGIVWQAAFNF